MESGRPAAEVLEEQVEELGVRFEERTAEEVEPNK